ncbi:unnamed protein product [Lymnaea stagnalis]|uniref:receptor protein-tyrosine kinase n=1 Tax=Lymnaea stagnalis TaxID=6523 RepID=A0AAV2H8N0_LYMST
MTLLFILSVILSSLQVAFGSKSPKVFSFNPNYGPRFGGTLLEFQGQHLNESNVTRIEVAGHECDNVTVVVRGGSNVLQCRTRHHDHGPHVGPVLISFDNLNQSVINSTFSYKENPEITDINPRETLASGGINMTVTGSHLDSAACAQVVFIYENQISFGNCSSSRSTSRVTCKAPDMSDITQQVFGNHTVQFVIAELNIEMDNNRLVPSTKPETVKMYRDPIFAPISSTNISLSERNPVLVLKGTYMPTFINKQEIKVTFGGKPCPVVTVNESNIQCDASEVIKQVKARDKLADKSLQSKMRNSSGTSSLVPKTTTPETVTRGFQVRRLVSNYTPLSQSASTTSTTTHYLPSGPNDQNQIPEYGVTVEIGNFKADLGSVRVVLDENVDSFKSFMFAVAGGAGLVILILIIVTVTLVMKVKKAKMLKNEPSSLIALAEAQSACREASSPTLKQILESVVEADARHDMDRLIYTSDKLTVGKCIGSGNFGCVYEGVLETDSDAPPRKVAIKTLQDATSYSIDLTGFVQEAVFMKDFQHDNVLGLVGLAEKEPGIPYVILPFMEKGDLLTYVRDPDVTLTLYEVIKFGADIAKGMDYLSSLKFVHRDLAARNCMLDGSLCVKVADFGLCRDIYEKGYYTSDNKKKLPIRWMALESIENGAYSTKSDVWSLGVVLWELLTRGLTPYPGVDGWDVVNFLRRRRLPPPFFCPESLYNLMMVCWAKDPIKRPTFNTIQKELLQLIGQGPDQSPSLTSKFEAVANVYVDIPSDGNKMPDEYKMRSESLETIDEMRESMSMAGALRKESTHRDEMWSGIQRELSEKLQNAKLKKTKKSKSSPLDDSAAAQREHKKCGAKTEKQPEDMSSCPDHVSSDRGFKVVKNITITIPESYSDRDVSKSAMGAYIKLVGNYEPPRKFSSPFRRLTKGHHSRASEKMKQDVRQRQSGPSSTANSQDTAAPVVSRDKPDDPVVMLAVSSGDAYFELEPDSHRLSSASDDASVSVRSTYTMRTTGSMGSMLDTTYPGSSFMNATGVSSGGDSYLSLAHPNGQQSRSLSHNNMSIIEI